MTLSSIKRWAERVFTPDQTVRRQFSLFRELVNNFHSINSVKRSWVANTGTLLTG